MPDASRVRQRVQARIAQSPHRLIVRYPEVRPIATGGAATDAPVSPLLGAAALGPVVLPEPIRDQVERHMPCLWLDAYISVQSGGDRIQQRRLGWLQGATAVARVLLTDGLVDPTDPNGVTVFDGADHVEFRGHQFRVMAVEPIGPSFADPDSLHVWLSGNHRQ